MKTKILIGFFVFSGLSAQCDWSGDGLLDIQDLIQMVDCILEQCWDGTPCEWNDDGALDILDLVIAADCILNDCFDPTPPFENIPAAEDVIMYEVNLRAFSSSGTFEGVTARLDSLAALQINTLWLMPIHPIGSINSVNSPYSVQNYLEVSSEYGSFEDFQALVAAAHQIDMAVVLDWVANHTAWDHPWIFENPEWYSQDEFGNIIHPPGTNWMDVADLNYDNPEMRLAMIDALRYWITEADVDGFRCDAADMVPFDFWEQAIDSLYASVDRDLILLAEGSRSDHFTAGFQLNYGWDFYGNLKNVYTGSAAGSVFSVHSAEYIGIPPGCHKLRFTTNHDESAWDATPVVLFNGIDGALSASVISVFLGGVPLIYTGQEVGTAGNIPFFSQDPIDWDQNPEMLQAYTELLTLYHDEDVFRLGTMEGYYDQDVVAFTRSLPDLQFLVFVNVRDTDVQYDVPTLLRITPWTELDSDSEEYLPSWLNINPYETRMYSRQIP